MSGSITTSGVATPLQPQTVGLLVDVDREHTLRRAMHALANRSANPAAMAPGGVGVEEYRSHGEREVMKWALRSARQLEQLLESL